MLKRLGAVARGRLRGFDRPPPWAGMGLRQRSSPPAPRSLPDVPAAPCLPALDQLGERFPPYTPTLGEPPAHIAGRIRAARNDGALIDLGIPGFLRPDEALKLYELAYALPGDTLELGTAWGLSTSLLAEAKRDQDAGYRVTSVELDADHARAARRELRRRGLQRHARVVVGDAHRVCRRLLTRGARFSLAFVDHDHGLEATRHACADVHALVAPSGLVLFHDLNDEANRRGEYGIYSAVAESIEQGLFEPVVLVGSALLVKRSP